MNQRGAILITLIAALVIMAVAGGWMLGISTTSAYGELLANRQQRAYYIAETGVNYARSLFDANPSSPGYTNGPFPVETVFTLSNGQFRVKTRDNPSDPTRLIIESTGSTGSGWLTTRQLVIKDISKQGVSGSTMIEDPASGNLIPIAFNAVDPAAEQLDPTWTPVPSAVDTIEVAPDGTMQFKGNQGAINLNPTVVDIATATENSGDRLGYFLQVKIDLSKMSPGDYYMVGLSFRVQDAAAQNSYGLSYYRSNGSHGPKTWWETAAFADLRNTLPTLKDDKTYAVLWKRVAGNFQVLAYAEMNSTYGVLDPVSNKWVLAPWATLALRVNEKFVSGTSGPSRNHITAYVQHPSKYPNGTINWNFANFKQVVWTVVPSGTGATVENGVLIDSTFTSSHSAAGRPEIGVHAFYDSFSEGSQLFDDFSTIIQGLGGGGVQS